MREDLKPTQKWWMATLWFLVIGLLGVLESLGDSGIDTPLWVELIVVVAGPLAVYLRSDKQ